MVPFPVLLWWSLGDMMDMAGRFWQSCHSTLLDHLEAGNDLCFFQSNFGPAIWVSIQKYNLVPPKSAWFFKHRVPKLCCMVLMLAGRCWSFGEARRDQMVAFLFQAAHYKKGWAWKGWGREGWPTNLRFAMFRAIAKSWIKMTYHTPYITHIVK